MKVQKLFYKRKKRYCEIFIEHDDTEFGRISSEFYINFKGNTRIIRFRSYVVGKQIPQEDHIELSKKMRENQKLKEYAFQQIREYMKQNNETIKKELKVVSVFVLGTRTVYSREVTRKGRDLSNIEEVQKEEHEIIVAVQPIEEEMEIHFKLTYNKYACYEIAPKKEYQESFESYYTYNWEEKLLEQILPLVKERVNFLLP